MCRLAISFLKDLVFHLHFPIFIILLLGPQGAESYNAERLFVFSRFRHRRFSGVADFAYWTLIG